MTAKKLKIIAISLYLFLALIAVYFKFFPTIVNSAISNFIIFMIVFLSIMLLVYASFTIKTNNEVYLLMPQALIFTFIARAIPNLRLSYPPLHDPYYHFVSTLNILEYYTLNPILSWWYWGVDTQLHWPNMHLITASLVNLTSIPEMFYFRFQEPFMGIIFFLSVFILTRTITSNNGVALLASLFASISDVIIFYQSEYHPQGLAIIYLVFILYAFIKSRQIINLGYRYISILFGFLFLSSHHFTPLFLSFIFISYIVAMMIIRLLSKSNIVWAKYVDAFKSTTSDYTYFGIIIIASIYYHIYIYSSLINTFLKMATASFSAANLVSIGQTSIPLITSILSSFKWGLFLLALISILMVFHTKNKNEFILGVLTVCIVLSGAFGNYVVNLPLDRIIGFYLPFASIFASLSLYRFKCEWFKKYNPCIKICVIVIIASIIISAGFFNSQTPAYFFKDSKVDTFYWYSNRLPSMDEYKSTGEWIGIYSMEGSEYGVDFDTLIVPYFYGKQSSDSVSLLKSNSFDYRILNPKIPYNYDRNTSSSNLNQIYNNNELEIYS